jgi:hypothetical protein
MRRTRDKTDFVVRTTGNGSSGLSARGGWLLLLFGLPFLSFGLFAGCRSVRLVWDWHSARSWVQIDARLTSVELRTHDDSDDGATHEACCTYEYVYSGRTYHGNRVGLDRGADSIGTWQEETYAALKQAFEARRAVPCLVDPRNPNRAVLRADLRTGKLLFWYAFASAFTLAGLGSVGGGLGVVRTVRRLRSLRELYPDEPWMWKPQWRDGVIRSGSKVQALVIWGAALFWNSLSWPAGFLVTAEAMAGHRQYWLLIFLAFPAVGILLLWFAVYYTIQYLKFARSELRLRTVPAAIGGRLEGELVVRGAVAHVREVRLVLSCVRTVTTEGQRRPGQTGTLWKTEQVQAAGPSAFGASDIAFPIAFAIPEDCPPWDDLDPGDRVEWKLRATAEIPGVNLCLEFPVPVFETGRLRRRDLHSDVETEL